MLRDLKVVLVEATVIANPDKIEEDARRPPPRRCCGMR